MIINHNISALNTYRQMGINSTANGKAMEKLSSGLRINRAGDDAAGLAISEKMRAQVRGLDQASRNAQDGISLIQTAEGALQETHSILQRMRELATQAANDTNVDVDREEIQKEINQLTSEINRIGNTTEFNTKKLLSSDGGFEEAKNNIKNGIENHGWLSIGEEMIKDFFGLEAPEGHKIYVEFENNPGSTVAAYVQSKNASGSEQKLAINLASLDPSTGESGQNGTIMTSDRILAHEMVHAVMNSAYSATAMAEMPSWFKEGAADFISGADDRVEYYVLTNGAVDTDKLDQLVDRGVSLLKGTATWGTHQQGASYDYAAAYIINKFIDREVTDAGGEFSDFTIQIKTNIEVDGDNGEEAIKNAIVDETNHATFADFISAFENDASTYIQGLLGDADVGSIAGDAHDGAQALDGEAVIDNTIAVEGVSSKKYEVIFSDSGESSSVKLQIGANQGQSITINLKDMRSAALSIAGGAGQTVTSQSGKATAYYTEIDNNNPSKGVTDGTDNEVTEYALDVSTYEKATAAIEIFNDAIEKVFSFRSELGAYQNRLEHTISNLENASENLTAAESRIRDVDMAKEVMEMTRTNILGQASQAMLAQANQRPQAVLQLLG